MANNARDTFGELRASFDGQDPFMTGGHQIIKTRGGGRTVPEWARSNKKIQAILLRSFPSLKTNHTHRMRAGRWATIIQLYFRMQMTRGQVAAHMKLRPNVVNRLIDHIHLASKGLKANNRGLFTGRSAGRPKKSVG